MLGLIPLPLRSPKHQPVLHPEQIVDRFAIYASEGIVYEINKNYSFDVELLSGIGAINYRSVLVFNQSGHGSWQNWQAILRR
jgi:hypothetical protein